MRPPQFRCGETGIGVLLYSVPMDPKYSDQDVGDIVAAIRKVYPAVMQA